MIISPSLLALLAFLLLWGILALSRRKTATHRKLLLFRALFPSWQFFDQTDAVPVLKVRVGPTPHKLGPWKNVLTPRPPWWHTFFLNPVGNLNFAYDSLVQQLIADAPTQNTESHPSYLLVRECVRRSLIPRSLSEKYFQFQIELLTFSDAASPPKIELFMLSPPQEMGQS